MATLPEESCQAGDPLDTLEMKPTMAQVQAKPSVMLPDAKSKHADLDLLDTSSPHGEHLQNDQRQRSQDPIYIDDIPEPIKVLDDIISEFDEATTKPVTLNSNSGENQSEDDGYMSLSRKNMSKKNSEDVPQTPSTDTVPEGSFNEVDSTIENISKLSESSKSRESTPRLIQTTLPKVRSSNSTPATNSKYSSLPCCNAKTSNFNISLSKNSSRLLASIQVGGCNAERNALGIDISAVHNAVLRGNLAKLPEPILNEHPVTIYPGPSAKASGESARGHRLLISVERQKVCHIPNPHSTSTSGSQHTSSGEASPASSNNNMATSKYEQVQDDYSEDSLEESTISTEIIPAKQNGVAWEIQFKSNKKSTSKKLGHKENLQPDFKNLFNPNESMLGKGTFVIRRSIAKKSSHSADIFIMPKSPRPSQSAGAISNEFYNSDSEPSESALLPPVQTPCDTSFMYKECNTTTSHNRRCIEIPVTHRAALSLDIATEATEHLSNKPMKSKTAMLTEKRLSAESMPDHTPSSGEFDEERLNGFDLFTYNVDDQRISNATTPHTDLAPTLEEDEELSDFSYGCAPLKQIEQNISALLRGDLPIISQSGPINGTAAQSDAKRLLEFRPGVHKSESGKEMLLSQSIGLGPLPPSPPSSNPDLFDYDAPLPPSPVEPSKTTDLTRSACVLTTTSAATGIRGTTVAEVHATACGATVHSNSQKRRSNENVTAVRHFNDELPQPPAPSHQSTGFPEGLPGLSGLSIAPAVPPHRAGQCSANMLKSRSIDSQYRKRSPKVFSYSSGSGITTPTGLGHLPPSLSQPPMCTASSCEGGSVPGTGSYQRKYINYSTKRSLKQSPREEHRLQTSCSLPETPIFSRGCDIPRTPYRRQNDPAPASGSRTAPRSSTSNSISMGNSIMGIGAGSYGTSQICRQRSMNHALASNEMLRMTGAPARGWYPKQRSMRPASTENIDRLASVRVWDNPIGMSGTGQSRKPLTLPPNLTPSFLNKSPREALRRVTSLLITKKKQNKDRKHKAYSEQAMDESNSKHAYEFESGEIIFSTRIDTKNRKDTASAVVNVGTTPKAKKKGLFKSLWKRARTASLDQ
ncbi:uncharacterized protein LOC117577417 isoform X1 [Drosophila albomicans]|uniref:Uncharacterized protein LOC117577417 isoform X1 n=1 Tax=Drosophila albomicans TaxID=7291 RepID=A0A9C6T0R2_DROAB|nr:uncharacterized protein LOC117577417 isoform X1 [Drosophila albomicans]XP_051858062.1 uncharacterized protein LOC117577417 isoform X1 [Drosophila albomicans]XP_051858063.1 uncharacterized protein LOC117577417 isoform X1 [Drosophila albomicans]